MKYTIGDEFTSAHTGNLMRIVGIETNPTFGDLYELGNFTEPVVPGGILRTVDDFEADVNTGDYIPVPAESAGIGVNGVPVSTTADCDVCHEVSALVCAVELHAGEWVCDGCSECIEHGICPLCGVQDGSSEIALNANHACHSCQAEAAAAGDYEDSLPYRQSQRG